MPIFKTPLNNYSIKFSPFYENCVTIAASQNFGILGNGRTHLLNLSPNPRLPILELVAYDTVDGVYDVAWSESHDSIFVAAVANGFVKLYDLALSPTSNPIRSFHEHTREVHSANYNPVHRDSFLTFSWEDTVKLWTLARLTSIRTFKEHVYYVYSAVWNPRHGVVFASASVDCMVRIWDVREPGSRMILPAHCNEAAIFENFIL